MRLVDLRIERLPGIDHGFTVPARPGVNIVVGPNESGKSSLARAVFNLLWPDSRTHLIDGRPLRPFSVSATFTVDQDRHRAARDDAGDVTWTRDGQPTDAPTLPGGDIAACYRLGQTDLVRASIGDLDQTLAQRIRREMAGGYDLAAVAEAFTAQPNKVRRLDRQLQEAQRQLHRIQSEHGRLAEQESRIDELEERTQEADQAGRRLGLCERIAEGHRLQAKLDDLHRELTDFPAALPVLRDDDAQVLAKLLQRERETDRALADLDAEIRDRQTEIDRLTAGVGEIGQPDLDHLHDQIDTCGRLTTGSDDARRNLAVAQARAKELKTRIDPEALGAADPDDPVGLYRELIRLHRDRTERRIEAQRWRDLARWRELADVPPRPDADGAQAAIAAIGTWFAAQAATGLNKGRLSGLGAALLAGLAAVILGALPTTVGADLLLTVSGSVVILAAAIGAAVALGPHHRKRRCRELERACAQAGHPLPADWDEDAALDHLLHLQQGLTEQAAGNALRAELRRLSDDRGRQAEQAETDAATARADLLARHGLPADAETPDLRHALEQIDHLRDAETDTAGAHGALQQAEQELAEALATLQIRFADLGLAAQPDLADLKRALGCLKEDLRKLISLQDAQRQARATLQRERATLQETTGEIDALLQRLGLERGPAVVRDVEELVGRLPDYVDLVEARRDREAELRRCTTELARNEATLTSLGLTPTTWPELAEADLQELTARQRDLADQAPALHQELADLRSEIKHAREGTALADAQADLDRCHTELATERERMREAVIAGFLLEAVRDQHEASSRTPILTAARNFFLRFTGGRYHLQVVATDTGDAFIAIDTETETPLALSQLSDGTRAQLLLSARLAFIAHSETGASPPLFLDEALTASDPERFAAVAGSLVEMAENDGRQVFYLTSNPADAAAWQQVTAERQASAPHVIDLAKIREANVAATADQLEVPALPTIPTPGNMSAAEYGQALQVPELNPWSKAGQTHLFYLLRDDLDLLHSLLQAGTETLGRWQARSTALVRGAVLTEAQATRLAARGDLLAAFLRTWRIGRGRPLDKAALADSDALSETMLPRAYELLEKTGPETASFVAEVENGGIKGLRGPKKELLQSYLEQHEYLDHRKVLSADEIMDRVLADVADHLAAGRLEPADVRRFVQQVYPGRAAQS